VAITIVLVTLAVDVATMTLAASFGFYLSFAAAATAIHSARQNT